MKSKSLIWFVAGVLLLCLCVPIVNATCVLDSVSQGGSPADTILLGGMGVSIDGTCDAGETGVYLWMSGSNPMAPGLATAVNPDGSWSEWWVPQCIIADAGSYDIYASTSPLPSGVFATHSVVLKKVLGNGDILVTTDPSGAFLYHTPTGWSPDCYSTPTQYFNIIPGPRHVRVGKYLYYDASTDVTVTAGSTTPVSLTLTHIPPTVTSITPSSGPSVGGTMVTITGDALEDATAVKFGATDATTFTHNVDHSITATAPAKVGGGAVDVTVINPGGTSAIVTGDTFTYLDTLFDGTITLTPGETFSKQAYNTGTPYTISRTTPLGALDQVATSEAFTYAVTDKRFSTDGVLLLDDVDMYHYQDPGKWYAFVNGVFKDGFHNHPDGLNVIELANNDQVNFYYAPDNLAPSGEPIADATAVVKINVLIPAPTFTSITQNSGPIDGGTAVTIVGSNFVAGGSFGVTIGGLPATNVIRVDSTHITAVTPAHGAGAVDVVITNNDGQSATGTGKFTYVSGRPAAIAYAIDKNFGGDPSKPGNEEKELQVSDATHPANTELKLGNGGTCPSVAYDAWVDTTNNNKNANLGSPAPTVPPTPKQFTNTFYADGEVPVVCESDFPPIDLAMSHAAGNIPNSGGWTNIDFPPAPDPMCANPVATNNYALLISGGGTKETNYNRYYNDIKFLYKTLINDYKYDPTHIKVLMSDGLNDAADQVVINTDGSKSYINSEQNLDNSGGDDVNGAADYNNISKELGSSGWGGLPSTATLLIFTTGHGAQVDTINAGTNGNSVNLLLWQSSPYSATEKITDAQFASLLPANPKIIMVMEQCYGGGFKNNVIVSGKTRTLAAAALGSQQSHSNDFSYPWITGASWHDSSGNAANADLSTVDGLIQALEAYNYGNTHDPSASASTETPTNNPIGTGADALTLVTCGSGKSITNVAKTPTPWVADASGTVTWSQTGLSGQNVKIDIMKGSGAGVWQATFYPQTGDAPKSATIGTATKTIPKVMTTGGDAGDYWLRISTTGTLRPPVIGTSGNFQINGATGGSLATFKVGTDSTGKPSLITLIDNSNGKEVQPGQSTPATFSLPGGSYTITLSRSCTIPMSPQTITLGSGEVKPSTGYQTYPLTDVSADDCKNGISTAEFGSIDITSLPNNGYRVYLKPASEPDTRYQFIGSETPTIWNVLPGDWTVKLETAGYLPGVKNVHVDGGDTATADFVLQPDSTWYTFTGFDAPVDMNGVVNTVNAGRNIPLKWHLSDKNGYVSDPEKFKVQIDTLNGCSGPLDEIEVLDTTTVSSVLTYQGNGAWHYNWKTIKADKGCRKVYLEYTSNGLKSLPALFKFK